MFVHLGGEVVVDVRNVVAILDARCLQRTPEARELLDRVARDHLQGQAPRAIVVTTTGLYPAPVSAATVARRIGDLVRMPQRRMAES